MSTSTGETPAGDATPTDLRAAAADFTWLLNRFATETAGVVDAIAVSSDGLLIAVSELREHADSERLAGAARDPSGGDEEGPDGGRGPDGGDAVLAGPARGAAVRHRCSLSLRWRAVSAYVWRRRCSSAPGRAVG